MAENILILGNGFDLAMGRKTSYGDFLKFARHIKVLDCHILQHYNKKDIQEAFSAFIDDIDELWENHEDDETKQSEEEQNFYNKLKADQKFLLISEHIFEKLAILKDDCTTLVALNSFKKGATKRYLLNQIREELKKDTSISNRFFNIDCVLELTKSSEKRNIDWLLSLPNNLYIDYIEKHKDKLGKNWSGIELAISDIAEGIQVIKHNLNQIPNLLGPNAELTFRDEDNYVAIKYIYFIMRQKFGGYSSIVRSKVLDNINDDFIKALDDLTSYLEFYLTYLDKVDFEIQKISPVSTALDAIQNIEKSKVITFNYTNTASEMLGVTEDNTHFVHGKCSFERSDDDINTMVFGIEDKEAETENINQDLIPYQKFYQRAVKETGSKFENFFKNTLEFSDDGMYSASKNIIIFGHSVDPLDKEIFKACFDLAHEVGYAYKFIFTYLDEVTKRNIVKNLALILGKRKLVELTGRGNIVFVKSYDIDQMRKELLN
ncbi:AbiH family protein [Streptococcus suis]|uniref:Phage abortive infection protein n=1 Tax=Streptococcus suis TaxID=1307 RepID=A0A0Z8EHU8_STRSU|nr:AbiH family protein [Streptococcus suis]MBY4961263.1 bacteriophage abortive infection AbiH family protein [Streptococcus suis]MBY4967586.1 bacteriophage abortive infection AbiH family protein [Streptococcus suis]MBY4978660.1 bacteriophage abortive infection AbiH family protein [Streptococcus suis]MBY4987169.1 bacteriophage abortive infection AbiH family protein [Streptococcus suis]MBY4993930.1 bacteriophage abortive infection AbiH family protein [Streptococcus suis]